MPGSITRPWDFRRSPRGRTITDVTTPGGRRYRCSDSASYALAQQPLGEGHTYQDGNGDGMACETLPR